ncbi:SDR family NAD(P)-dependent oxidoreductase [Aquimarina sp. EL_43]|uniref:SDR family NAD(P)-dependent oxidoreductase n=2 Tax=Aquimarina TaxID=290174 RepID=UPI0021121FB2|nr:SDR family NAD(P)-dependent oxidoreductase [Aquimarina sp. EL_43]
MNKVSENRTYSLNIPQMLWDGLSENWLMKELGDIHWKMISEGLETESDKLIDSNGNRLYASFVRIKWESNNCLSEFSENEEIEIKSHLSKYGKKMFFSNGQVSGHNKDIKTELMSVFSSRNSGNNEKLVKGTPLNVEHKNIPVHNKLPEVAKNFFKAKSCFFQSEKNEEDNDIQEIILNDSSFNISTDIEPLFQKKYQIDSYDDINGVGLLYFASYPKISDKCELSFFQKKYIGEIDNYNWAKNSSTIARDIHYYGNANANEELVYNLEHFSFLDENTIKLSSSLVREKDGMLIAKIFTIKKLSEPLNIASIWIRGEKEDEKESFSIPHTPNLETAKFSDNPSIFNQNFKKNSDLSEEQLCETMVSFFSEILENKEITIHTDLRRFGVESIVYTELSEHLNIEYGLQSNPSTFYGLFTVKEIASFLLSDHSVISDLKEDNEVVSTKKNHINSHDIAIVGLSLKVPGANNKEEFWENLVNGNSCITTTPKERWDWPENIDIDGIHKGINYGGYIKDVDKFDASFFEISPREAKLIDPQQRILLELTWELIENSGYKPSLLKNSKTGVFIGASGSDYETLLHKNPEIKEFSATGTAMAMLSNRISYFYDLDGPSLTIDTACSSSLVAINNAVAAIQQNQCEQAIVGGIHLMCEPTKSIAYKESNMLSVDGKCYTFDDRANGYVRGEGAVLLLLKPMPKAIADSDNVLAIIKSTAVNHGGYSGGVTVPNPNKQKQLIEEAYTKANIDIQNVSYIETHGTGTSLGDPIEILGLTKAFQSLQGQKNKKYTPWCGIGSVKTNIGHLEAASGIAGLLKVIMAMKHNYLPPTQNFKNINSKIEIENKPFHILENGTEWLTGKDQKRIIAGVSSFGIGGANAHVVIESYENDEIENSKAIEGPHLFILSARREEILKSYAKSMLNYVSQNTSMTPYQLSYTLQSTKEEMEHRLAFAYDTIENLKTYLTNFLEGTFQSNIYVGSIKKSKLNQLDKNEVIVDSLDLEHVAEQWCLGKNINWRKLYPIDTKTLEVPTYPFDHKRGFWAAYKKQQDIVEKHPELTPLKLQEKDNAFGTLVELPIPIRVLHTTDDTIISSGEGFDKVSVSKPANISLKSLNDIDSENIHPRVTPKAKFTLDHTAGHALEASNASKVISSIKLYDRSQGVYSLDIDTKTGNTLSKELIEELMHSLNYVKTLPLLKVLILTGTGETFLQGDREAYNESITQGLYQSIVSFPYPIIAEMQGDAMGSGFLLGALCDFMVCSEDSRYGYTDITVGLFPFREEESLFGERFGDVFSRDFLYRFGLCTGTSLKKRGWSVPIVASNEVHQYVEDLALSLSEKPVTSLGLLKRHLGRDLEKQVAGLKQVNTFKAEDEFTGSDNVVTTRSKYIELESPIEGVLTIRIATGDKNYKLKTLISGLEDILNQLENTSAYKVLVLSSTAKDFLRVSKLSNSVSLIKQLQNLLINAPVPVIAAFEGNATDIGWLLGQCCDVCIYHTEGIYSASGLVGVAELGSLSLPFFVRGLGDYLAQEVLLTGREYSGLDLQQHTGSVVISANPITEALDQAGYWSLLPIEVIRDWKKAQQTILRSVLDKLPIWIESEEVSSISLPEVATEIELRSQVIKATLHPEGIVEIKMEDREAKNMFSDAFMEGMIEIFDHIAASSLYKVVILTGYDSYFISGGTKEMLLDIQEGKIKFTDTTIYHLAMDCNIPVIASMQGHGIGAGWSMGMFSDFPILSTESHYVSPYMNYGFTPGAGSTLIFPERIGYDLARGTLLTGIEYSGKELNKKGVSLPVVSRKEIGEFTFTLARELTRNTRDSLIAFKHQITRDIKDRLEDTYTRELSMHEKTFVGRSDTLERIEGNFNTTSEDTREQVAFTEKAILSKSEKTPQYADVLPMIKNNLKNLLAQELHMEEDEIDEDSQFVDLGLDSIIGVTWIRKINEKYKISINATKIYSYPNLIEFSRYVKEEMQKLGVPPIQKEAIPVEVNASIISQNTDALSSNQRESISKPKVSITTSDLRLKDKPQSIAIIGMAGQFPMANNVETFWNNIVEGKNCISEISQKRWDIDKYYQDGEATPGKTYSKWMGALEEYDLFDPLFFNISPSEAECMDPQQRLFLQTCWHAIENAGYNAKLLEKSKCGVFVGCGQGDYHLLSDNMRTSAYGFTGGDNSILAARISYFLNLQGPCLTIDTACSSSLVAIANACDSLILGQSDLMLAGGVYIGAGADMHIKTSQMGMLSSDGKCHTFDQNANGFVPGEGVGVVMLKRLEDAENDGDNILGVIKGWGINQDGKTNGITAPNTEAQSKLQQEVYDNYRIDPSSIQLVEAHGTGTKLGDPIEVEALVESFTRYTSEKAYCALGSVKSNIGHCLMAAGVAGVIKLLMSLKYKKLPPTINFENLNEHISIENSPFYVNTQLKDWQVEQDQQRQAAISSFGFSGTNAHMVISEYNSAETNTLNSKSNQDTGYVFPLSAKTEEQLKQKAVDILAYLNKQEQSCDLDQVAYTMQIGRMEMEYRLGVVASTQDQLVEKLNGYIEGKKRTQDTFVGKAKNNETTISLFSNDTDLQETIDKWIQQKKLSNLIKLWVEGYDLDWNKLYGKVKPQRIQLPLYPFAKERYWIEENKSRKNVESVFEQEITEPLFFREYWKKEQRTIVPVKKENRSTIVFANKEFSEMLKQEMPDSLSQTIVVEQSDNYQRVTSQLYKCSPDNTHDIEKILAIVNDQERKPIHILYLWAKGKGEEGIYRLFDVFKTIRSSALPVEHITLVGHYNTAEVNTCWDYSWIGFERSLKLLLPNTELSLFYIDSPIYSLQLIAEALQCNGVLWYKNDQRYRLSLQSSIPNKVTNESVLKQKGNYLITGGCGKLGLQFARFLAENYQANLLLIGRTPISSVIEEQLAIVKNAGAGQVHYRSVDVSDKEAMLALRSQLPFEISGIIHAAGIASSQPFYQRSTDDIKTILYPKTYGTIVLDEVLNQPSLDFICYFSSVSAFLGDFGSCDYALASRFQMAYSFYREQKPELKSKTMVINWPLWEEGGMGTSDAEQASFYLKSSGQEPLKTSQGIGLWHDLIKTDKLQTLVMLGKPSRIEQVLNRLYVTEQSKSIENVLVNTNNIKKIERELRDQGISVKDCVTNDLKQQIASLTKINQNRLKVDQNLTEYGFDSISLGKLASKLAAYFEVEITPAVFFSATTIQKLVDYILEEYPDQIDEFYITEATNEKGNNEKITIAKLKSIKPIHNNSFSSHLYPKQIDVSNTEPIAVVGMSGRFPQAQTVDQLWSLLSEGKDAITEIPTNRWDWSDYYIAPDNTNNKITTNKGGFIHGVDKFDPLFFGISPREAEYMDPAERLLLIETYKAIEDARISPKEIKGKKVGVFVGMEEGQYDQITGKPGITTTGNAMISSRLSYFLDLQGPAISTNTACSSGLVALHQAVSSLRQGECKSAIVAGVSLLLSPESYIMMSEAGMLSEDGRCHTFSKNAKGIGVGESVVVLMLKPLSTAIADDDTIYGTIKASGINFDGKTNGVTAPNGDRQAALIEKIYTDHQINTNDLSYIVTHGTGTKLGDPVEINALAKAFKKLKGDQNSLAKQEYCALTSCKSNIGHTLAASGLVSVVNLLKAMQHRQIPASLNCVEENDYITWRDSPFYINKKKREWTKDQSKPYLGAVSSFGRSGTNAHVVIEEFEVPVEHKQPIPVKTREEKVMILLSARTEEQLYQKARDVLDLISEPKETFNVQDLAYSLQVCKEEFEVRLGFLINTMNQLIEKLEAYLEGSETVEGIFLGKVKHGQEDMNIINGDDDMKEAIEKWITRRKLPKLMELWVKGLAIDWKKFYGENHPKRIALPAYPFAQDRYWIDSTQKYSKTIGSALHPLVHYNTSNLIEQSYSSTFSVEQPLIAGYRYQDNIIITTGIYLEMARAAVQMAAPSIENSTVIQLNHLKWGMPCIVDKDKNIKVSLSVTNDNKVLYEIKNQEKENQETYFFGNAILRTKPEITKLDISELKKQIKAEKIEISGLYDALKNEGVSYEKPFQVLDEILVGNEQVLAKLVMPVTEHKKYVLHPAIIEGVIQASTMLSPETKALIPVAMGTLTVISAYTEEMFAWIRITPEEQSQSSSIKLDIDLCDKNGNSIIIIRDLELVKACEFLPLYKKTSIIESDLNWDKVSYQTQWEEQPIKPSKIEVTHKNVLIVCSGNTSGFEEEIQKYHNQKEGGKTFVIKVSDKTIQVSDKEWQCGINDPKGFQVCLQSIDTIDIVYFLSLENKFSQPVDQTELRQNYETQEIQFLRLVKSLKQENSIKEKIETYVLTLDTHTIHAESNQFIGAGITGLAYSLAQGSYQFRIRNLDVSSEDIETSKEHAQLLEMILQEPPSDRGEVFKIRSGKRYRQKLYKLNWSKQNMTAIRQNGVYIIVGGSGTVGKIITHQLMEKYEATVVWIGRSEVTSEKVKTAMKSFDGCKGNLEYMQADVTDLEAMQETITFIKQNYITINGAVFSGMIFNFENSLDQTTEEEFRSIFDLKAQGSWVFYTALKNESLDFMCYFSSGQAYSFSGASKLSAYASGITYADSLVHSIRRESKFPIGIINWGFWKSSLDTIEDGNEEILTDNFEALENNEGYQCFEQFIGELCNERIHQALCMKASSPIKALMNCDQDEFISYMEKSVLSSIQLSAKNIEIPQEKIDRLKDEEEKSELEDWLLQLLYCQIEQLIKVNYQEKTLKISDLRKRCGVLDKYTSWWDNCLQRFNQNGYIQFKNGTISSLKKTNTKEVWNKWEVEKEKHLQNPDRKAWVTLVDNCLEKLPEILTGKVLATDIIFPNASMEKVEGVYKNNLRSDTFNEIIANAVATYIQQKLQSNPEAKLRILEIGAGTGGTSAIIFSKLQPFKASIDQYCYTDLSKVFFFHAEEKYLQDNPYIHCQRLDIEQPIEDQDIEAGSYDLVIATNVLHATRDIRQTLRNAKAILNSNGYLFINELSTPALFNHLTFGLLDGWWLFKDADLRMPGSPGVTSAGWQKVLKEEGFPMVLFPAEETHNLGQQIVLAQTDGVIRRKISVKKKQKGSSTPPILEKSKPEQPKKKISDSLQKSGFASKPLQDVSEYTRTVILDSLSKTLKISLASIDSNIAFSDYGIDSILGVSFINQINEALSISLNTAIIFEHSSVNRLEKHIVNTYQEQIKPRIPKQQDITPLENKEEVSEIHENKVIAPVNLTGNRFNINEKAFLGPSSEQRESILSEIAVVGISGMFPKADNIEEFWHNLENGIDGVSELPDSYLDQRNYYSTTKQPGKTRCKWGGILEERDCFDPLFFNISPKEAESMNPHQRLILQESWKAIENAGYNPKDFSETQTGIYIGAEPTGYTGETFTGYSDAIIASRLSYILNLNGPSFVVNTGCSSSAVALHLACESLRNKETDLALAGGVNACLDQNVLIRLDKIEMLSPKGRCFTFDQTADGTIMSEGIGMVVLKRLEDAVKSGDKIYGVISGSGINQDGASNGITAPNGAAQEKLIVDIYNKFNIDPEKINYVEAHGTGTKLGDPVETNALVRAFQNFTEKKEFCVVGSAKSYVGHAAAAAGVIGLIKVLLSLQENKIPKLLNFKTINPLIEFTDSPFYINTEIIDWSPLEGIPRMAAINSFGHSGTNAHIVVKEYLYPEKQNTTRKNNPVIIPLSARTPEQLSQKAIDLLRFISYQKEKGQITNRVNLTELAYTLQVGREAMEERLGFVVSSIEELVKKLKAYINRERSVKNTWIGQVKQNNEIQDLFSVDTDLQQIIDKWITENKLSSLTDLWVKGLKLNWYKLYEGEIVNRIPLPSYPFAKERYWLNTSKNEESIKKSETSVSIIHPLLHQNTSDLSQQCYTTAFNGKEFFLRDHKVNGHKVLPAVAYLEMALAAVNHASTIYQEGYIVELQNVVWLKPLYVDANKQASISLFDSENKSSTEEKIDFEIYSNDTKAQHQQEEIHCQGQAIFIKGEISIKKDIDQLKAQMCEGIIESHTVYSSFKQIGMDYGLSHQGVSVIYMGAEQLLAQLSLPVEAETDHNQFTLHPSVMDSALQACIGLMVDVDNLPSRPLLPFALESVHIISKCTSLMYVWVRYSQGCKPGDRVIKLDLDLCDQEGNVCVQILGFSSRILEEKIDNTSQVTLHNQNFDDSFYSDVIEKVLNNEISVEEAAKLN